MAQLTDLQLARCALPYLPARLSQRRSSSRTRAVSYRSFEELRPWPRFLEDARSYCSATLDNTISRNLDPLIGIFPLDAAADEIGVRVPIEAHLFPRINHLASTIGLDFRYKQGGSNRSLSYTDLVILDDSQPHPQSVTRHQLSGRVFAVGEVKGFWQWDPPSNRGLDQALNDLSDKDKDRLLKAIQQMFGDMILDEVKYGFVTNYNHTVFFRRVDGTSKILEFSPAVTSQDGPIQGFLFFLHKAEQDQSLKPSFSRLLVPDMPRGHIQQLRLPAVSSSTSTSPAPRRSLRLAGRQTSSTGHIQQVVYEEDSLSQIPTYGLDELGISGQLVGLGKYGNVLEGEISGMKLAIKMFDLRFEHAGTCFVRELKVYNKLEALQGKVVPELVLVGRIPHCNVLFLALTDEGDKTIEEMLEVEHAKKATLGALEWIHAYGVLHNDLKLRHIKWNNGPKFIDFESSVFSEEMQEGLTESEELRIMLTVGC